MTCRQGYLSDLKITVGDCTSVASVQTYLSEAYSSGSLCSASCQGQCSGPGQHSCKLFIQLSDPYSPTFRVFYTGDSVLFDDRSFKSADVTLTVWFNSQRLVTELDSTPLVTMTDWVEYKEALQIYNKLTIDVIVEQINHVHTNGSVGYGRKSSSSLSSIGLTFSHFAYESTGMQFVSISVSNTTAQMQICNFIGDDPYCKNMSINKYAAWQRSRFDLPNRIYAGIEGLSEVLDLRYYHTQALTKAQVIEIYQDKLLNCKFGCELCKSPVSCERCSVGFRLDTTSRYGECTECPQQCPDCTGVPTECGSCKFSDGTSCDEVCRLGTYSLGRTCYECHSTCLTCSDATANRCLSCDSNLYRLDIYTKTCVPFDECLSYQYLDADFSTCVNCIANCGYCSDGVECLRCFSGYYLQPVSNMCGTDCPDGYWSDVVNQACVLCHDYCIKCRGPSEADLCSTCYYPAYWSIGRTACRTTCDTSTWMKEETRSCERCHELCYTCTGPENLEVCTACRGSGLLQPNKVDCLTTCPVGYYGNYQGNFCDLCPDICVECTGLNPLTQCSVCKPSFDGQLVYATYIMDGCAYTCELGYYKSNSDRRCMPCHPRCVDCDGPSDSDNCSSCQNDGFLQPSSPACLTTCPKSYFGRLDEHRCVVCHKWCAECSGPNTNQCTACRGPALLSPTRSHCDTGCVEGYWPNYETNNCDPCHSSCSLCNGPTNASACTDCRNGAMKQPHSDSCLYSCPDSYWGDRLQGLCKGCHEFCTVCTQEDYDSCAECSSAGYKQPNASSCRATCPLGYLRNSLDRTCESCGDSCVECIVVDTTSTECHRCKDGLTLQPTNHFCAVGCPPSYWANPDSGYCVPCDPACLLCTGQGPDMCQECADGYALQPLSSTCELGCPVLYWQYQTSCLPCEASCLNCDAQSDAEAEVCGAYCSNINLVECQRCLDCLSVRCASCIVPSLSAQSSTLFNLTLSLPFSAPLVAADLTLKVGTEPLPFTLSQTDYSYSLTSEAKTKSDEQVRLVFLDPAKHSSLSGLSLKRDYAETSSFEEVPVTSYKTAYESSSQSASAFILLSGVTKMDFKVTWLLMGTVQLVSYAPIGFPFLPDDLKEFLGSVDSSSSIPNIFSLFTSLDDSASLPSNLTSYGEVHLGYTSASFIENAGPFFTILLALIVVSAILGLISLTNCCKAEVSKLLKAFYFNIFLRVFIQFYMKLSIAALIQVFYGQSTLLVIFGALLIVSSTQVLQTFLVFLFSFLLFKSNLVIMQGDSGSLASFSVLFKEFRNNYGLLSTMHYPLFCLRRLLVPLCFISLAKFEVLQCVVQILLQGLVNSTQFSLHSLYFLPFLKPKVSMLAWYCEIIVLGVYLTFPVFLIPMNASALYIYGILVKLLIYSTIVLSMYIQVGVTVKFMKMLCRALNYKIKTRGLRIQSLS